MPNHIGDVWRDSGPTGVYDDIYIVLAVRDDVLIVFPLRDQSAQQQLRALGCHALASPPTFNARAILSAYINGTDWIEFGQFFDVKLLAFNDLVQRGQMTLLASVPSNQLCDILECALQSPHLTNAQRHYLIASKSAAGCP